MAAAKVAACSALASTFRFGSGGGTCTEPMIRAVSGLMPQSYRVRRRNPAQTRIRCKPARPGRGDAFRGRPAGDLVRAPARRPHRRLHSKRPPPGRLPRSDAGLDELLNGLQRGDRLIVSELFRLGRSLGQIVAILDALAKAGAAFVAIKENIRVDGKRDIQTKVMTTLFALFAEVERDLISERTREGLARARASGRPTP